VLVRFALSTCTPTVDERVQSLAPRASVKPVGAEPYFEMLPRALVAAAVPVPEVVPPALSTVNEIELSTVPVTVSVPELVAAKEFAQSRSATAKAANRDFFKKFLHFSESLPQQREKKMHVHCHLKSRDGFT